MGGLVIPGIATRLASKAAEKGVRLADIDKPRWLQGIGKWLDEHHVSTPEKIEAIIKEHEVEITLALTEREVELSELGKQIFEAVNELKEKIDNARLTNEDEEFLAEVKKNFDPDEFESRLERLLKENAGLDSQQLRDELTTFFEKMGWDDKLDVINSKLDLVFEKITEGIIDIKNDTTDIKKGLTDIQETLEQIPKSEMIEIHYPPDPPPPDVSRFVDRETHLEDLSNSLDAKNMIVIQGIAGIGKTQLAAKLKQTIEKDYKTFWMQLDESSTLYSVAKNLAGFLRVNGNFELADYILNRGSNPETIIYKLLSDLENKNYVLFFDDYHKVKNEEVHKLFRLFKDRLSELIIVITTGEQPPFISQIDRIKKKVTERGIEGFDADATKVYLKQIGVEVTEEQLIKINEKIGGHPQSLELFASLVEDMEVDEILDNLPKTDIGEYLFDEFYDRRTEDEKRVFKALSIFRRPVPSEACVYVAHGENVKEKLKRLEKKFLVKTLVKEEEKRKEKLFYLHDLIKELAFENIDKPKEYHRRAGEYYAQLEKTPENIQETTYQMIKDTGSLTDEVVKYLIGTPMESDPYVSLTVLDLLKENEITSLLIFELFKEFTTNPDLTKQKMFIIEYGDFFGKIHRLDHKKSVEVLRQILGQANHTLLTMLSRSVAKIAYEFPVDACELWKNIIEKGDREVRLYVSYDILDSNLDANEAAPILKYLIETSGESADLWYAKTALKNWGILETQELSFEDHLEKLREMSIDEKLLYIKQIKDKVEGDFVIEILDKIYLQDPDKVAEVLKLLVKNYHSHPTTMQRIPRILAKLAKEDINYLKFFLMDQENNEFIKFVGLRGLDLIKFEIEEEKIYALLTPMLADNNPVLRELASILSEEIKASPSVTENNKEKGLINPKSMPES